MYTNLMNFYNLNQPLDQETTLIAPRKFPPYAHFRSLPPPPKSSLLSCDYRSSLPAESLSFVLHIPGIILSHLAFNMMF